MLVLSRKVGERIHIGNDIFVEVRKVAGNRVTLAINAPKSVRILRGELMEAAQAFDVLDDTGASTSEAANETVIIPSKGRTDLPGELIESPAAIQPPQSVG